jgi:hypothetical protein
MSQVEANAKGRRDECSCLVALRGGCCGVASKVKSAPPSASGGEGHVTPEWELHSNLAVAVREPVETRAAKRKIPPRRLPS